MGYKPHTRKRDAHDHRDAIRSVSGVSDVEIVNHDDDWLFAMFEFRTRATQEAEDVYADISDWFMNEANPATVDSIDTPSSAEFDGRRGTFTVFYPT